MSETEKIFYDSGDVLVTSTRFAIGDTSYFINTITSVTVTQTKKGAKKKIRVEKLRNQGLLFIAIAVALVLVALILYLLDLGEIAGSSCLLSVIFGIIGISQTTSPYKTVFLPEYHLVISSAAGEKQALTSDDPEAIKAVAGAINRAKSEI